MSVERVLFLCTANQCRSPVAAALLRQRVVDLAVAIDVESAGLLPGGFEVPEMVTHASTLAGLDVRGHRSRQISQPMLEEATLVLGMAREHVREAVLLSPPIWSRTFTLREAVRRGRAAGPRTRDESLPEWLSRIHADRRPAELLGASELDDVRDPMGGPAHGYRTMVQELSDLIEELTHLAWPTP